MKIKTSLKTGFRLAFFSKVRSIKIDKSAFDRIFIVGISVL